MHARRGDTPAVDADTRIQRGEPPGADWPSGRAIPPAKPGELGVRKGGRAVLRGLENRTFDEKLQEMECELRKERVIRRRPASGRQARTRGSGPERPRRL